MPQIVEVPGRDNRAATWVAAVTLPKIDEEHLHVVKAFMRKKPFYFGFFVMSNKHLVIMHSKGDKVQRSQCTSALEHVLRVAGINAAIGEVVVLNGYHLELLGFRPNPGPALPKKVEPDIELDEEEEEQLWAELLPENVEAPICMVDVNRAWEKALSEKQEMALAVRRPASSASSSSSTQQTDAGRCIVWCTEPPLELEVASQRTLGEWQKLEWVLLRCESEEMRTSPSLAQFADFYAIYVGISKVKAKEVLESQAFKTFAEHVKKTTGATVERKELSDATVNAVRRLQNGSVPGKHCQNCNRVFSDELTMDIDGNMIPKHAHGMFCTNECAKGRCKGCSFPLDEQKRCVKKCGIRSRGMARRATWREYFELYRTLEPEAAAWCKAKLRTSTEELLNSTMDVMTYGGFFQITPESWF